LKGNFSGGWRKKGKGKNIKNQKPVEYSALLSYIIGMMKTTFFLIGFDACEAGRPL
jgi:hypothetical protein